MPEVVVGLDPRGGIQGDPGQSVREDPSVLLRLRPLLGGWGIPSRSADKSRSAAPTAERRLQSGS